MSFCLQLHPLSGQLEARLDSNSAKDVSAQLPSHSGNYLASTKMEGTLVGESKFLQADPQGCTMGATWKEAGQTGFEPVKGVLESEKTEKTIKHEIDSSSLGSTSKLLESLQVKNEEDPTDPLRILEGAVNAIREARHEDGGHSLASSAFLSARASEMDIAGDSVTQRVDVSGLAGDASIPLEDLLQSQQGWGNVLRHFGADAEVENEKPLRRQDASHRIGENSETSGGGYPAKLERLDETDLNSLQATDRGEVSQMSDKVQDSLDLLQDLQQLQQTNGSTSLGQLGSLQRPIVKDDFATLAAATPEDFDAFLARLKGQDATSSRGRSPQVSGVKEIDELIHGGL